jgi:Na+/H+ antiporter NhaD/arsenite permease-like protein
VIRLQVRGRWWQPTSIPEVAAPKFNAWQSTKGGLVIVGLVLLFLFSPWPREVLALAAAGILLLSRRMASRDILALIDWNLLVLFMGLFVVNHALEASGTLDHLLAGLETAGVVLSHPGWLFTVVVVLSNLVSNVPAVMLLLPAASHPSAGPILALASTLAGNLFIVGSIANIIVVDQAARLQVRITWKDHVRVGLPVTLLTLVLAAGWLWLRWKMLAS